MDTGLKQINHEIVNETADWIVPRRIDMRLLAAFATIIVPWVSFYIVGLNRFGDAEWQDGQLSTYFDLSFAQSVWTLFIPFLVVSTVSVALLLWQPDRFAEKWLVRFGVYTGTLLAIQFTIQLALSSELAGGLVIGVVGLVPMFLVIWGVQALYAFIYNKVQLYRDHEKFWPWAIGLGVVFAIALISALVFGGGAFIFILFMASGVVLCPVWGGIFSTKLFQQVEKDAIQSRLFKLVCWLGWGGAYGAAGTIAVNRVFELYTQLPDQPPNCYVATASAKGHIGLTGAMTTQTTTGERLVVTRQLQILKGGELILRQNFPRFHRSVRLVYDRIGPQLANRMESRWSADIGYLFFKPFEWGVIAMIQRLYPDAAEKIDRFYLGEG